MPAAPWRWWASTAAALIGVIAEIGAPGTLEAPEGAEILDG